MQAENSLNEFLRIKNEIEKVGLKVVKYEIDYLPKKDLEKHLYSLFQTKEVELENKKIILSDVKKKLPNKIAFTQSYDIANFIYVCEEEGIIFVNYKNKEFSIEDLSHKKSEKVAEVLKSLGYKFKEFPEFELKYLKQ